MTETNNDASGADQPKDYGPARAGSQDYQWQRDTLLATLPWSCSELPTLDGTGDWRSKKVSVAQIRKAVAACLADGDLRRDLQVLEQRAHLVESGEDDSSIPWHSRSLDERSHRAAFWLLHAGCRLAERRATGAGTALRAGGRILRLLLADRRIRTVVDRAELLTGALALAAAGSVADATEAVAGLRVAAPVDGALTALIAGDIVATRRAAQGVAVRRTRGSLHAQLADAIGPLVEIAAGVQVDGLSESHRRLGLIREEAAAASDAWTWWRARLLRVVATTLPARVPALVLAEAIGELDAARLGKSIAGLGASGLALVDDDRAAALKLSVSDEDAVIFCSEPVAVLQCTVAAVMKPARGSTSAVVCEDDASARAVAGAMKRAGAGLSYARVRVLTDKVAVDLRKDDVVVGTAGALLKTVTAQGAQLQQLIVVGLPGGIADQEVAAELAREALVATARAKGIRRVLIAAGDEQAAAAAAWWGAKPKAKLTREAPPRQRAGVLFVTDGKTRIAWRDAIGTLQPEWVTAVRDEPLDRMFPTGKNEAVAAAAVRFARLGPTVVVCAAPKALTEVVHGAMTAAMMRESVLSRHNWPHDVLRNFERAAREHALNEPRLAAAQHGFASWSRTDAPALQRATEELLASAPARVAIVDTDFAPMRLAPYSNVLFTSATADGTRLDAGRVAAFARHAGIPGVDRQGVVLIAVDGRRARQQVARDLKETDDALAELHAPAPASGLLWTLRALSAQPNSAEGKHGAELVRRSAGAGHIDPTSNTLAIQRAEKVEKAGLQQVLSGLLSSAADK